VATQLQLVNIHRIISQRGWLTWTWSVGELCDRCHSTI